MISPSGAAVCCSRALQAIARRSRPGGAAAEVSECSMDFFGRGHCRSIDSACRCSLDESTSCLLGGCCGAPSCEIFIAASSWPALVEQEWSELARLTWGTGWARPGMWKRVRGPCAPPPFHSLLLYVIALKITRVYVLCCTMYCMHESRKDLCAKLKITRATRR